MNEYEIIPSRYEIEPRSTYYTKDDSKFIKMLIELNESGMEPYEAAKRSYKRKRPDIRLLNTYEGFGVSFGIDIDSVEEYIIRFR